MVRTLQYLGVLVNGYAVLVDRSIDLVRLQSLENYWRMDLVECRSGVTGCGSHIWAISDGKTDWSSKLRE